MMRRLFLLVTFLFLGATAFPLAAQESKQPDTKPLTRPLWADGAPGAGKESPEVIVYPAPADKNTGAAIVICPGGGYGGHAINHEGHDIAKWCNSHGITGVIVKYRLGVKNPHPIPLGDAQRAIQGRSPKRCTSPPRRKVMMGTRTPPGPSMSSRSMEASGSSPNALHRPQAHCG